MSKLIRIKDETYQELVGIAKWTDTMDGVISKLLHHQEERATT